MKKYLFGFILGMCLKDFLRAVTVGVINSLLGDNSPYSRPTYNRNAFREYTPRPSRPERSRGRRDKPGSSENTFNFAGVVLDTAEEVDAMRIAVQREVEENGRLTVADFYEMAGPTSFYNHTQYGWTSLEGMKVIHTDNGEWVLYMPRAHFLND